MINDGQHLKCKMDHFPGFDSGKTDIPATDAPGRGPCDGRRQLRVTPPPLLPSDTHTQQKPRQQLQFFTSLLRLQVF